ncbi:MAG: chromophore lyase CpcT/CpeT [Pseudomonadota bacterium]
MSKSVSCATFLLLLSSLVISVFENPARAQGGDVASTVLEWWPGDYNNDNQIGRLVAAGKPVWRADGSGKPGHIEVTSHYRHVDLPAFGDAVLYVEETKHGDPNAMFRQRIYTLGADPATDQVTVKLWYFKDKERYVGAWKDLSLLSDLLPEDMSPLPDNCDLTIRPQGEKLHMTMPPKACVFGERYFDYQVLLGPDTFWFRDRIVNAETDEVMEAAGDFTYHELDAVEVSATAH